MSKKQLTPQLTPIARVLRTAATVLTSSTMLWPIAIPANPTGGEVVNGDAQITNPAPGGTVINQQSNAAIINWQDFSIGDGEYVVFNQPSVSAATLNRVIGNLPSEILGNLTANGRVFVINPQGVMFGANARVDVGALVTSTGNIRNEDFLAGDLKFSGNSTASIVNRGQISAANGGFVVLSADKVTNRGTIQAPDGDVLLAAGRQLSLQLDPEGLISYSVDAAAASETAGVENFGDIIANGGAVVMAANVARNLIGTAINNSGRVTANAIEQRGGEIYLIAEGGNIEQRGTLDASSQNGDGGTIAIRSDRDILLAGGSSTRANGRNGGEAIAVAGQTLRYEQGASMSVADRGAGSGGFAELSGRDVYIDDIVDLGRGGDLLIDPVDFLVANRGGNLAYSTLESQLEGMTPGSNVTIAGQNSVTFEDYSGATFDATTGFPGYGGSLTVTTGTCIEGDGLCTDMPIKPAGVYFDGADDTFIIQGDITLNATATPGGIINSAANLQSFNGSVSVDAPGAVTLNGVSATNITVNSTGAGVMTGSLSATDSIKLNANGGSLDAGSVTVSGGSNPSTVELIANDSVRVSDINASTSAYGGTITVVVTANANTAATAPTQLQVGSVTAQHFGTSGGGTGTVTLSNAAGGAGGGNVEVNSISIAPGTAAPPLDVATATITAAGDVFGDNDGSMSGINANLDATAATLSVTSTGGDVYVDDLNITGATELTALQGSVISLSADDDTTDIFTDSLSVEANTIDLGNTGRVTNITVGYGTASFGTDTPFVELDVDGTPGPDVTPNPAIPPLAGPTPNPAAPNAAFKSPNTVQLGNLEVGGRQSGYLYVQAPGADVDVLLGPLSLVNFRPYSNAQTLNFTALTGALRDDVLTYLLGGTGYTGTINFGPDGPGPGCAPSCQPPQVIDGGLKSIGSANYVLYTEGNIVGLESGTSTTGQVIILKGNIPTATPVPTPTPTPEPTPTPTPEPTPTPVVTPTPTPVATPTPTPVVTPTPTPVVTPTPTPVITPTPTPVVTPTPTPVITPTPTPMADMTEILTALAEAPKTDDPFLRPTPTPNAGQGEIQRRDTSYQIGEFSCDATGVQ